MCTPHFYAFLQNSNKCEINAKARWFPHPTLKAHFYQSKINNNNKVCARSVCRMPGEVKKVSKALCRLVATLWHAAHVHIHLYKRAKNRSTARKSSIINSLRAQWQYNTHAHLCVCVFEFFDVTCKFCRMVVAAALWRVAEITVCGARNCGTLL